MGETAGIVGEFLSLKEGTDADLLAMQVGDFYEFFGDDAETVAAVLDLKVSQKSTHGSSYPMAGVPVADLTPYLRSLVERGYRVAVADQYETPEGHAREVTRVVTPGTLVESDSPDARYLASVVEGEDQYGVAFADVTTGRFTAGTLDDVDAVVTECYRFDPVELLPGPTVRDRDRDMDRLRDATDAAITRHDIDDFAPGAAHHSLRDQFGRDAVESLGLGDPAARAAAGIIGYVGASGVGVLASMTRLTAHRPADHVVLDATTQRNLELLDPLVTDGTALIDVLDHTVTGAGTRTLRSWLTRPRRDEATLDRRVRRVAALSSAALARDSMRERLGDARDLERLAARVVRGSAGPRDLLAVRDTLGLLPAVSDLIASEPDLDDSPLDGVLSGIDFDRVDRVHALIDDALHDDAGDGDRLFRPGVDAELDAVIERHDAALAWIEGLADRERRDHGITHLQVDRNRTDGYYIQVGKSEVDAVPPDYLEIKTLKNSKRYETEALREREREILRLEEERGAMEDEILADLLDDVAAEADLLQDVGRALAALDVYASLAEHAARNGWTAPSFGGAGVEIEAGRHPVVEQTVDFVPNDAHLADDRRFLLVTGPNMSGKSTYLRGTALVVLLAQIGSFVPADGARVDPVDGIFTRVGALDELAGGRSTFMVEMQELANILHSATDDSLVVLDEIGRGTATYDGISIAWAATEYLARGMGSGGRPLVLFATHYHELTGLADRLDGVANAHVAADERDGEVTFLRSVREGATDRSYGIHVAELAGVPDPVVERARTVLESLREEHAVDVAAGDESRQVVFDLDAGELRGVPTADGGERDELDAEAATVLDELRGTSVPEMAPLDLARRVQDWQRRLEDP